MKKVLILLVNSLKTFIEKDNDLLVLRTAYNNYISDETDGINYIYNIKRKKDLIDLINLGASAEVIAKLHESGNSFVMVKNSNEFISLSHSDVVTCILHEAENIARCVIAYPFVEAYKPIYIKYITDNLIE